MSNVKYVGRDVHKAITVIVVLNALGQFESRSQVKTKSENITRIESQSQSAAQTGIQRRGAGSFT